MSDLTIIIDSLTGTLLVEGPERVPPEIVACLQDALGPGRVMACAVPLAIHAVAATSSDEATRGPCIRIAGYYHNSLIEGPGRRSTVKVQGCAIQCRGCLTPESWDPEGGTLVPADRLAGVLLDPVYEREGISMVGGEPVRRIVGV